MLRSVEAVFVHQGPLDSGQWHAVADVGSSGVEASGRAQGQEVSHGCLLPASGVPLSGTDPWLCRDMPLPVDQRLRSESGSGWRVLERVNQVV